MEHWKYWLNQVILFDRISTLYCYLMPNSVYIYTWLISEYFVGNFTFKLVRVYLFAHSLMVSGKWLNSCIWPINRTWIGTPTLEQRRPGNDSNKGLLHIPQSPRCILVSYIRHSLKRSYSSFIFLSFALYMFLMSLITILGYTYK